MTGGSPAPERANPPGLATCAVPDAHLEPHLESLLRRAYPRLLRLTRSYGIVGDEANDVVQETQIHAWRQLAQLRAAERFDAWLDAICRNQCRMYLRSQARLRQPAGISTTHVALGAEAADEFGLLASQSVSDPYDELERRELADLVARALEHLPPHARTALELYYLRGWALAKIAAALDTSIAAQEMRLRRARAHLRKVLLDPLRDEAAAFGLVDPMGVTSENQAGWQATRITCYLCGGRPLEGRFALGVNQQRELRLRCPACSQQYGVDVFRSKGLAPLGGLRVFRPALTRAMRALHTHGQRVMASGYDTCLHCDSMVRRELVRAEAYPDALPLSLGRHWVVACCPRVGCPGLGAWAVAEPALWSSLVARQFMADHPRWLLAPDDEVCWKERPAILLRMDDRDSAARLAVLVDAQSLDVLDTVEA